VKVGPECTNCYAERWQFRLGTRLAFRPSTLPLVDLEFEEAALREVLRRRQPTKWFWCDQTDIFLAHYPDEWIDRCFAVMEDTPRHTHQILTKRADRMREYLQRRYGKTVPENLWCGVSCGNVKDGLPRLDALHGVGAAVRFVSAEPLLEDLGTVDWSGIHWLILGGESRQRKEARPCDLEWIRSLVRQGREQGVAVFVKQLGSCAVESGKPFATKDRKGSKPEEWPADLRVREMPLPVASVGA
jgi:protein gp37